MGNCQPNCLQNVDQHAKNEIIFEDQQIAQNRLQNILFKENSSSNIKNSKTQDKIASKDNLIQETVIEYNKINNYQEILSSDVQKPKINIEFTNQNSEKENKLKTITEELSFDTDQKSTSKSVTPLRISLNRGSNGTQVLKKIDFKEDLENQKSDSSKKRFPTNYILKNSTSDNRLSDKLTSENIKNSDEILENENQNFSGKSIENYSDQKNNISEKITKKFSDDSVYIGEWSAIKGRHGKGRQEWPDGSSYSGEWMNDQACGKGTFKHHNGDIYEGNWENDKAHGKGEFRSKAQEYVYKGEWADDLQEGFGIEEYANGMIFKGMFKKGEKNGQGELFLPDKSHYKGAFQSNLIHGHGIFNWKNGKTYEGAWVKNKIVGYGKMKWSNGISFEGMFLNGKKNGKGIMIDKDGKRNEGVWIDDKVEQLGSKKLSKLLSL